MNDTHQQALTLDEIRKRLKHRRPGVVGKAIGMTPVQISRIRDGAVPMYDTVIRLTQYFEANP